MKKKSPKTVYFQRICCSKTLKIMRNTLLLLLLNVSQIFAINTYSQSTILTLDLKDKTIKEVLSAIEAQSEFFFFYNSSLIDLSRKTSITVTDQKIDEIIAGLFNNTDVNYTVINRQIILSPNEHLKSPADKFQQRVVTGTIQDQRGDPLPGVTITVRGTTQGTVTNSDGFYRFELPEGAEYLTYTFVGMLSQEVFIGDQQTINVTMESDLTALDEVVVVGYGTQKRVNITGSVTSVTSEQMERREATTSSLALTGELSGVSIRQMTGNPREASGQIRIRGLGTFSSAGNQPLVLVDGIPSSVDRVDPNDIESVSVLKDAASASIYGSEAANGVILIQTKQGAPGVTKFNFYSYLGRQQATMLPEMAPSWIYAEAYNEALTNMGQSARFTTEEIQKYRDGTDPDYPNYDHIGQVWNSGTGLQHKHGLSMSGGTDETQYNVSLSYLNHEGVLKNNDKQDYNIRLNLASSLRDNLKLSANLSGNKYQGRQPGEGSSVEGSGIGRITRGAMRLNNTIIGVRDDGYFGHLETVHYADLYSPSFFKDEGLYLFGTGALDWEVIEGLTVTGRVGYTNSDYESKDFRADYYVTPQYRITPNYLRNTRSNSNVLTAQALTNYNKVIGNHRINILAGFEQKEFNSSNLQAYRNNFPVNELHVISAGSVVNQTTGGTASRRKLRSLFGRVSYDYLGKYLAEVNIRYDGSSRFPADNRWGMFPSFSAGWRISEEEFFQVPFVSDLKIRGSWGQLGNQAVGDYPYQNLINLSPQAPIGNSIVPGAAVTTIPSKNITWETTTVTDIGVDLILFDGRLSLMADRYTRVTTDILYSLSRSMMLGAGASPVNAGEVENKGWDFEFRHRNSFGDFSYMISGNLGINHNKVLYLEGVTEDIGQGLFIGHPIGSHYGFVADGLFVDDADVQSSPDQSTLGAEPGYIRFKDISGPDGVPDGSVTSAYDRQVIGQPIPITTYALSLNADYKGFYMSAMLQGEGGRETSMLRRADHRGMRHWMEFSNNGNIQQFQFDERWTEDNPDPNAGWPKLGFGGFRINNRAHSTFWMRDATFLRLKNLQVGYNLSTSFTQGLGVNNVRLYVNGENLFTIHSFWPNWDPEMLTEDIFQGWHPLMRTFLFGINIEF